MQTVQIVLDEGLLHRVDRSARRLSVNRSALVRDALRHYLARLRTQELEARDRRGYLRTPDREFHAWDDVAAWPDE